MRPAAPDFVRRDFSAEATELVWCGDMTEIETGEGKLYLATVIDLFSRRLLGYAMGAKHDADLVVAALHMAAATRGGDVRGVVFHSDRGSEGELKRTGRATPRDLPFRPAGAAPDGGAARPQTRADGSQHRQRAPRLAGAAARGTDALRPGAE